jgi:hypothetical protein
MFSVTELEECNDVIACSVSLCSSVVHGNGSPFHRRNDNTTYLLPGLVIASNFSRGGGGSGIRLSIGSSRPPSRLGGLLQAIGKVCKTQSYRGMALAACRMSAPRRWPARSPLPGAGLTRVPRLPHSKRLAGKFGTGFDLLGACRGSTLPTPGREETVSRSASPRPSSCCTRWTSWRSGSRNGAASRPATQALRSKSGLHVRQPGVEQDRRVSSCRPRQLALLVQAPRRWPTRLQRARYP